MWQGHVRNSAEPKFRVETVNAYKGVDIILLLFTRINTPNLLCYVLPVNLTVYFSFFLFFYCVLVVNLNKDHVCSSVIYNQSVASEGHVLTSVKRVFGRSSFSFC